MQRGEGGKAHISRNINPHSYSRHSYIMSALSKVSLSKNHDDEDYDDGFE